MPKKQKPRLNFERADMGTLNQERNKLARLYVFLKRYIEKTIMCTNDNSFAIGLFSSGGILLDMFAKDEALLEKFRQDGLSVSDIWSNMGHNAVTSGLKQKISLSSVGDDNEDAALKKFALYFSPINMLSVYEPYKQTEQCGVAIISYIENASPILEMMVAGIAHDMMITLQFNNIATMYYERSGKGLLSIDNKMSGSNLATYYNDELFRLLNTEPVDIYYKPVEALIDPLPANQELWDIVNHAKTVSNQPISVTSNGSTVELIASTDAFNQPSINAHGVIFYFTTQQKITAELSEKVANGAIKTFDDIKGNNAHLKKLVERARRIAMTDSNIMILGESGTGKDVFAQAIHNGGSRSSKPFIALNCSAMPKDLIESELFGYESGAFTGARKNGNIGKFELASGGTIFLDEIGEMPLDLQAKLLRVVEQKQFMRLGGTRILNVDVRIIAATNANVDDMLEQKLFRADLYYRLSTMKLHMIPLRARKDDIVPLAEHFIRTVSQRIGKKNIMRFSPEAKTLLESLSWPRNVRELQNLVECIVQLYPGDIILPEYVRENISNRSSIAGSVQTVTLDNSKTTGREDILKALAECKNNRSAAAKALGMSRRTFYRRLKELNIL